MKVNVTIDAERLIKVTGNEGGYMSGRCLVCDRGGWLTGTLGLAHNAQRSRPTDLIHKADCPINPLALKVRR